MRDLDGLNLDKLDAEEAHAAADRIVYALLTPEVQAAYDRVVVRGGWWGYA